MESGYGVWGQWGHLPTRSCSPCPSTARGCSRPRGAQSLRGWRRAAGSAAPATLGCREGYAAEPTYWGRRSYPTLTLSRVWSSGLSHCSQPRLRRIAPAPRRTPPRCAPASRKLFGRTSIATRVPAARYLARHEFPPPACTRGKGARLRRASAAQCSTAQREAGEGRFEHVTN